MKKHSLVFQCNIKFNTILQNSDFVIRILMQPPNMIYVKSEVSVRLINLSSSRETFSLKNNSCIIFNLTKNSEVYTKLSD